MNAFTVDEVFSKRIDLEDPSSDWPYPLFTSSSTVQSPLEPRFQTLKDSLNATKSSLNHLNLKEWHQHTCNFNSANALMQRIKYQIKPELFTQAWVKMIEILNVFFTFVPDCMKTLHICESPGAFISATNHHFNNIKWTWKAISLNPYYEGNTYPDLNNDDRNARCNLSNWDYGASDTGSVIDDIEGYFETLSDYGADLVTADGSINCLQTPNEQENMVLELKTAEIILALKSLKVGGSFVIKFFTFFEPPTIRLMYMLSLSFKKMSIFKPVASKEGNSEVYLILRNYNGKMNAYLGEWIKNFKSEIHLSFCYESIPSSFLQWVYNSAVYFSAWQQKVIERNLISYNIAAQEPKEFQQLVLKEFFYRYPLKKTWKKMRSTKLNGFELKMTRESKINDGDFETRTQTITLECIKNERLKYLERLHDQVNLSILKIFRTRPLKEIYLHPVYGKPFSRLNNSKFCCLSLIYLYRKTLEKCCIKDSPPRTNVDIGTLDAELANRISSERLSGSERTLQISCDSFLDREASSVLKMSILDGLIRTLNGLRSGENFVLVGFPTFSRFYTGILFILSHIFDGLTFIRPQKDDRISLIILEAFKESSHVSLLEDIYAMLSEENPHLSLLSIVSIDFILRDKQFFESVLCYNYLCLVERVTFCLDMISP